MLWLCTEYLFQGSVEIINKSIDVQKKIREPEEMDWTKHERYGIPSGNGIQPCDSPQEVSLVTFTLQPQLLHPQQLYRRLQQAYASGSLKLVKRIHALLALAKGKA